MRFDKSIDLIIDEVVEDGLGGRMQLQKIVDTLKANVEDLSVMETYKIYGIATTESVKARVLGKISVDFDKIKYDEKLYKVINKRYIKNKTAFLLELIDDEH